MISENWKNKNKIKINITGCSGPKKWTPQKQRQFRILGWTVPDAVGNGTVKLFSAESSSFVVGTVVVLVRNCRLLCPKAFLFFLFASALLHGCCGFLVALFVSLPGGYSTSFPFVTQSLPITHSKTLTLFLADFVFFRFFCFPSYFHSFCLLLFRRKKNKMSCSRLLLASLLQFASAFSFFSSRCCFLFLDFFCPSTFLQWKALLTYTYP